MSLNPFTIPFEQPTSFEVSQEGQSSGDIYIQGTSIPINLFENNGNLTPKITTFLPRINNPSPSPNPINTAGIPGANFIGSDPSTPVFYQGEDIVYDIYPYINNQCVDLNRYNLHVIVKASQYSLVITWSGVLGNGIYADKNTADHFVVFIPNADTDELIAGTFELDLWAVEKVGKSNDIKPRTLLVGKTYFEFEYAAFSPNPESLQPGSISRCKVPNTYPPFVSAS